VVGIATVENETSRVTFFAGHRPVGFSFGHVGDCRGVGSRTVSQLDILLRLRKYIRIMRKSLVLDALFPAVRQGVLATTLLSPDKWWYLSELASHLGTSPSSLQRELVSLTRSGILERKQDGRRTYYRATRDSAVFDDLRALLSKTAGIVPALQAELTRFHDRLRWAAIYGSVARSEEDAESDIDLLLVGELATSDLLPILRRLERQFGREVNIKRYSEKEFRDKMRSGDHFLKSIVAGKLISLMGSPDELEKAARRT
jgi:predicted nucleotidyltransferase/DNA-binding MarR family transcriptional regulator